VTAAFDPTTPNMARVYDYWFDGKDNYPADRAEAQRLLAIYPPLRELVRENRAFVTTLSAGPPGRGSASSLTWAPGSPPPRRSTRLHGKPCQRPGSPTSTSMPSC
jgi:S-adenosyl methyltransferase